MRARQTHQVLPALLVLGCLGIAIPTSIFSQQTLPVQRFQRELRSQIQELQGMKKWNAKEDRRLKAEARKTITRFLIAYFPTVTDTRVDFLETQLNEYLALGFGSMTYSELQKYSPETRYIQVLESKDWHVVGYWVGHGITSLGVIQIYATEKGSCKLLAEGGQEFNDHIFSLMKLAPQRPDEARFLAYGKVMGATQGQMLVVAYLFREGKLQAVFSRIAAPHGRVEIKDGLVRIKYVDSERSQKNTPPYWAVEEYAPSKTGLKLLRKIWEDD